MEKDQFYKKLLANLYEGVYFVDRQRTVTYWNDGASRLTGYCSDEVMGKCCRDNILMHLDKWGHNLCDVGQCPAEKAMREETELEMEVCYHHKDGHRVPALARFIPYRDEDKKVVGVIEVFQDTSNVVQEREKTRELAKLALLDPLTHLANRRFAEIRIKAKLSELERHGWTFGILFCDLDEFKLVNDHYGHETGDQVLEAVATTLKRNLRSSDLVSRWGGDEFLVMLPNVKPDNLRKVADKIRRMVEQCSLSVDGGIVRVTASIGGTLAEPLDTLERLLKRADGLMYGSKRAGANRVTI